MKTKELKFKQNPSALRPGYVGYLRIQDGMSECKFQFILWAHTTYLNTAGIEVGEPCYRPAICAWEAWQAAWKARV